jgi:hypothetical protein
MKLLLEGNFSVTVRHQIREELPETTEFYQGIYSVSLNFLVYIMFVPELEINPNNWPPVLPKNVDDVSSETEARLFTTALSKYTVTPHSLLAGTQEIIFIPSANKNMGYSDSDSERAVIFYVSHQEFNAFSKELVALADRTPGVHDFVRIAAIEELEIAKFITSIVMNSQCFSAGDLEILGMKDILRKNRRRVSTK